MRQRATFDFRSFLNQGLCPATMVLIIANGITFVTAFFAQRNLWIGLTFSSSEVSLRPWSLLTYPLVSYGIFEVLLAGYMLWLFGGSLERAWGTSRFLRFLVAATAITSGSIWIGSLLLQTTGRLSGLWLPLSALVVAWCLMNREAVVLLFFVLPIKAKYLAWLDVAFTFFGYGQAARNPWLGFFALAGCGFAYLYLCGLPQRPSIQSSATPRSPARTRPPEWDRGAPATGKKSRNPLILLERWQRKRRFKRLWENSGMEEMFRESDPDREN